jgi:ribulose bisphosphate carboxylase small subunit
METTSILTYRETMARYVRLAGIDEKGVTETLSFLPPEKTGSENVVNLFNRGKE